MDRYPTEPCVHGHFDCAFTEGGPCSDEAHARRRTLPLPLDVSVIRRHETPNTPDTFTPGQWVWLRRGLRTVAGVVQRVQGGRNTTGRCVEVSHRAGLHWYYPGDLLTADQRDWPEAPIMANIEIDRLRKGWREIDWDLRTDYDTFKLTGILRKRDLP